MNREDLFQHKRMKQPFYHVNIPLIINQEIAKLFSKKEDCQAKESTNLFSIAILNVINQFLKISHRPRIIYCSSIIPKLERSIFLNKNPNP